MKKICFCLIISVLLLSCGSEKKEEKKAELRVASLVPSITELLYELGLDKEVVAVTEHCIVPKNVDKAKLSTGAMNPPLETILEREPNLVFTMTNRPDVQDKMRTLGIRVEKVKTVTFEETMNYFTFVGALVAKEKEAEVLVNECRDSLAQAVQSIQAKDQRVLLSISTLHDQPGKASPWIAGRENLYDDLLKHFKVPNAYGGEKSYLKLSTEKLLEIDPEVVFILKSYQFNDEQREKELKAWQEKLPNLKAVKNNKIYMLGGDYMMLTGPRIPLIIREFEQAMKWAFE